VAPGFLQAGTIYRSSRGVRGIEFPGLFSGYLFRNKYMGISHLFLEQSFGLRAESLILLAPSASSHTDIEPLWLTRVAMPPVKL